MGLRASEELQIERCGTWLHNSSGLESWTLNGLLTGLHEERVCGTDSGLFSAMYQFLRMELAEVVLARRLNLYMVEAVA